MPNPYDFVPIAEVERKEFKELPKHNSIASELTGEISCTLTTKSNFSIKDIFEKANKNHTGIFIPGSSIRGMIRATMEAFYGGCGFKIDRSYDDARDFTKPYPHTINYKVQDCYFEDHKYASLNATEKFNDLSKYANCSARIDALYPEYKPGDYIEVCEICSLFGFISESGLAFKSRLIFSDSNLLNRELTEIRLPRPDKPRVFRRSFYFKNPAGLGIIARQIEKKTREETRYLPGGEYNGRKFYLHGETLADGVEPPVYAIEAGADFSFSISFNNINETELGMLLFALKLDGGMYHKLGYGKPVGMGSVKIKIDEIKFTDKNRYQSLDSSNQNKIETEKEIDVKIAGFLDNYTIICDGKKYKLPQSPHFKKLKQIWNINGMKQDLVYPDLKKFFGKEEYDNTTLPAYNKLLEKGVMPKPKPAAKQVKKENGSAKLPKNEPPVNKKQSVNSKLEEAKSKKDEDNILELKIYSIINNQCFVKYKEKEIKVAGFIENAVVGKLIKGFIKNKRDGSDQFIPKKKE